MAGISLYSHQAKALERMKNGCILCGGVGSGKSRTALAYYYQLNGGAVNYSDTYIPMNDPPMNLYIITTARKRDTLEWEAEMGPFLITSNPEVRLYKHEVVVDSWNNIKKYTDVRDAFFIFDEQRVVGSGVWVKSFLQITKQNQQNQWILLSATPGDKWEDYIPVFVANGFFKNRTEFSREHLVYENYGNFRKVSRYLGTKKLERLRNSILVDMDFDRKTTPHHETIYVDYNETKYRDICKTRWNTEANRPIRNAAEYCFQLRKLVNTDESRTVALLELFEKHPRIIIFYNFDYELELLKGLYWGEKTVLAEWNGHKHEPVPDSRSWVYLVQYAAGAEGWNCVKTDTIIFYSLNYSYKVMIQASGRIDRLNTPFTDLYYYHLKSRSGIDNAISKALQEKRKFNENAFAGFDKKKPLGQALFTTGNNDWETPQDLYDRLNWEFHFTLDPCATSENAKCEKYYTEIDDGLSKDWGTETVFCNPPYSNTQQTEWVRKCYEHGQKGGTAVMLIPARTDTKRFHDYILNKAEIRFLPGRLRFGDSKNSAPFPSMVVVFGPKWNKRANSYLSLQKK